MMTCNIDEVPYDDHMEQVAKNLVKLLSSSPKKSRIKFSFDSNPKCVKNGHVKYIREDGWFCAEDIAKILTNELELLEFVGVTRVVIHQVYYVQCVNDTSGLKTRNTKLKVSYL